MLSVKNPQARAFYETEALRGGWSIPQLNRQIGSWSYECTELSHHKAAMLEEGEVADPGDATTPEQAIKDPFVPEFLECSLSATAPIFRSACFNCTQMGAWCFFRGAWNPWPAWPPGFAGPGGVWILYP